MQGHVHSLFLTICVTTCMYEVVCIWCGLSLRMHPGKGLIWAAQTIVKIDGLSFFTRSSSLSNCPSSQRVLFAVQPAYGPLKHNGLDGRAVSYFHSVILIAGNKIYGTIRTWLSYNRVIVKLSHHFYQAILSLKCVLFK